MVSDLTSTPGRARSRTRSSPTARSTSAPTPTTATRTSRSSSRARSRSSGAGRATAASSNDLYDFSLRATAPRRRHARRRQGRLARRASATSSATGMGEEKLDNSRLPDPRARRPRRRWRGPRGDAATVKWANEPRRRRLRANFERTWWNEPAQQYADSLGPGNAQLRAAALDRRHADGDRRSRRGRWPRGHRARRPRDATASAAPPRSTPACSTRAAPAGRKARASGSSSASTPRSRPSPTATTAASQRRYTDANAKTMLDEQPGALPEILPSPDQNGNIDRCWTCRSMFMQAWGHYGTAWPVIAPAARRDAGSRQPPARRDPERPARPGVRRRALDPARARTARSPCAPCATAARTRRA